MFLWYSGRINVTYMFLVPVFAFFNQIAVVTRGQYFHFWEKNIPIVNRIFCQDKMLEYAYN